MNFIFTDIHGVLSTINRPEWSRISIGLYNDLYNDVVRLDFQRKIMKRLETFLKVDA